MFPHSLLSALGRSVYGGIVPAAPEHLRGAETYLPELWAKAPFKVAFTHSALALVVWMLPPLILRKPKFFSSLSDDDRTRMLGRMLRSRFYFFRLIAYGVRGHALIAILRDEHARAALTPARPKQVLRAVG